MKFGEAMKGRRSGFFWGQEFLCFDWNGGWLDQFLGLSFHPFYQGAVGGFVSRIRWNSINLFGVVQGVQNDSGGPLVCQYNVDVVVRLGLSCFYYQMIILYSNKYG